MITFNHEGYISKAIEGILMQNISCPIELIIGEDYSTDNTRNICQEYRSKFPDIIQLVLSEKNIGFNSNFASTFQSCTGKYIAICEGDDYWIDPYKLQKQVDFLEANPDYGLIHTDCDFYYEASNQLIKNKDRTDNFFQPSGDILKYLLRQNCIKTLTVCFRKSLFDKIVDLKEHQQNKWLMGDYPMWLEFAYHSKIKYIPDSTAVYRVRKNSLSRSDDAKYNFNFRRSAFDIRIFMIKKFNLAPSVLKLHTLRYADMLFKYSHVFHEPQLALEAKTMLKNMGIKTSLRQNIYLFASGNSIFASFLNLFLAENKN